MLKYEGGNGSSIKEAITIVNVKSNFEGIDAEYDYISKRYGPENKSWKFISQKLIGENSKKYDRINFCLTITGECKFLYFDISNFFAKVEGLQKLFPGLDLEKLNTEMFSGKECTFAGLFPVEEPLEAREKKKSNK